MFAIISKAGISTAKFSHRRISLNFLPEIRSHAKLYTGAGGANNVNVTNNGSTFTFEDPMDTPGGGEQTFAGIWGLGNNPNGPVLLDDVLAYLHTFDPNNNTPVFNFYMNQVGSAGGGSLDISGQVTIWNPVLGGSVVQSWAFDNLSNNIYNPDFPVTAPGTLVIPGLPVTFNNNLDSGKADYVAYAPTMSLADWAGKGYLLLLDFRLAGLTNGFEELYLTGSFVPCNPVSRTCNDVDDAWRSAWSWSKAEDE